MSRELPTKIEDEQKLIELMMSDDIKLSFKKFVLTFFPWEEEHTPLANISAPRGWQIDEMEAIDAHCQFNHNNPTPLVYKSAVCAGRGIGKTTWMSWLALWLISTRPGMSVICLANSEMQLKSTLWAEISKWLAMLSNKHWFDMQALSLHPAVWYADVLARNFGIDSKHYTITCRTYSEERPDAFVGHHNSYGTAVLNDEASGTPDVINASLLGHFTEINPNRFWIMMSNPRRLEGWFYDIFNKPFEDWRRTQIDTRTVEGIDPSFHEGIISRYGIDSDQVRVEVLGQFPQQEVNSFIPAYKIEEALAREPIPDEYAPLIMGCDIAGEGSDSTVIVFRRGYVIEDIIEWHGKPLTETKERIAELDNNRNPDDIVVDANGIGAHMYDALRIGRPRVHGVKGQGKAFDHENYNNKRTELAVKCAEWLEFGCLPNNPQLIKDLRSLRSFNDNTGRLALESKRTKGAKSTDYSDALCLTFAVNPARKDRIYAQQGSYEYEAATTGFYERMHA